MPKTIIQSGTCSSSMLCTLFQIALGTSAITFALKTQGHHFKIRCIILRNVGCVSLREAVERCPVVHFARQSLIYPARNEARADTSSLTRYLTVEFIVGDACFDAVGRCQSPKAEDAGILPAGITHGCVALPRVDSNIGKSTPVLKSGKVAASLRNHDGADGACWEIRWRCYCR